MDAEVWDDLRFNRTQGASERVRLESRYAEVWAEFGPSLVRLTASYEVLPQAREDLIQDIRLAIWMALPRFRGESSMRTFVFRIAHNRALTHVWKRKSLPTEEFEGIDEPDPSPGPDEKIIGEIESDKLQNAIRSLPLPMMQVLTMALEDIPHKEIAVILGTTEGNVAVRLNRARGLIRQKLGGRE